MVVRRYRSDNANLLRWLRRVRSKTEAGHKVEYVDRGCHSLTWDQCDGVLDVG